MCIDSAFDSDASLLSSSSTGASYGNDPMRSWNEPWYPTDFEIDQHKIFKLSLLGMHLAHESIGRATKKLKSKRAAVTKNLKKLRGRVYIASDSGPEAVFYKVLSIKPLKQEATHNVIKLEGNVKFELMPAAILKQLDDATTNVDIKLELTMHASSLPPMAEFGGSSRSSASRTGDSRSSASGSVKKRRTKHASKAKSKASTSAAGGGGGGDDPDRRKTVSSASDRHVSSKKRKRKRAVIEAAVSEAARDSDEAVPDADSSDGSSESDLLPPKNTSKYHYAVPLTNPMGEIDARMLIL
jgi:hypothetical protein